MAKAEEIERQQAATENLNRRILAAIAAYNAYLDWDPDAPAITGKYDISGVGPEPFQCSIAPPPEPKRRERPPHQIVGYAQVVAACGKVRPSNNSLEALVRHYGRTGTDKGFRLTELEESGARAVRLSPDDVVKIWWVKLWKALGETVR